jgi:hypothetical protein
MKLELTIIAMYLTLLPLIKIYLRLFEELVVTHYLHGRSSLLFNASKPFNFWAILFQMA